MSLSLYVFAANDYSQIENCYVVQNIYIVFFFLWTKTDERIGRIRGKYVLHYVYLRIRFVPFHPSVLKNGRCKSENLTFFDGYFQLLSLGLLIYSTGFW